MIQTSGDVLIFMAVILIGVCWAAVSMVVFVVMRSSREAKVTRSQFAADLDNITAEIKKRGSGLRAKAASRKSGQDDPEGGMKAVAAAE